MTPKTCSGSTSTSVPAREVRPGDRYDLRFRKQPNTLCQAATLGRKEGATPGIVHGVIDKVATDRKIRQAQFYFLYATEEALARR